MGNYDYKDRIETLAERLAEQDGKDYFTLSENQRNCYYAKAYQQWQDGDL